MSITDLHPLITRNLAQMGYAQPRPIQEAAREPILSGRDVIGLAQTGTGKTAAFAAPILHHLLAQKPGAGERPIRAEERLRALILCPTRELAQQVQQEAGVIAQGTALRTVSVFGKVAISPQAQAIARGVDLVVGTPGRVIELLDDGRLSLAHVRHIVIDEGDRMLDMGFLPQVRKILERVGAAAGVIGEGACQMMLFSATMPPAMEDLARTFMRDPVRLEIGKHTTPVAHVTQRMIPVPDDHKVEALLYLLGVGEVSEKRSGAGRQRSAIGSRRGGRATRELPASDHVSPRPVQKRTGVLIFCRTRRRVGWVGTALERNGIKAGMIHGDRSQAQRQKALDRFKDGELDALVATDVAARGLHIAAATTVVNYDLPVQPEEYVHRIGRAAHGVDDAGEAFTLLDPEDRLAWRAIVDVTGIEVFAEHDINGWTPPEAKPMRRGKPDSGARGEGSGEAGSEPDTTARKPRRDQRRETRRRKGRSHASAPIRKGQKPGGGVKRRA